MKWKECPNILSSLCLDLCRLASWPRGWESSLFALSVVLLCLQTGSSTIYRSLSKLWKTVESSPAWEVFQKLKKCKGARVSPPFIFKAENSIRGAGDATELFHHAQRATSYKAKVHRESSSFYWKNIKGNWLNLKNEQQVDFLDVRLASNLPSRGLVRSEKRNPRQYLLLMLLQQ